MNWVDLICLGIIILGALSGLTRGFTRECIGLFGWIVAATLANRWYPELAPKLSSYVSSDSLASIAAFLIIFALASIVINTLANAVVGQHSARISLLGRLDRLLGALCGGIKGYAGLAILYLLGGIIFPSAQWPDPLQESQIVPYIYDGARFINNLLPNAMQRDVIVPQTKAPRATLPMPEEDATPSSTQAPSTPQPEDENQGGSTAAPMQ